jgi:hypothetical protein
MSCHIIVLGVKAVTRHSYGRGGASQYRTNNRTGTRRCRPAKSRSIGTHLHFDCNGTNGCCLAQAAGLANAYHPCLLPASPRSPSDLPYCVLFRISYVLISTPMTSASSERRVTIDLEAQQVVSQPPSMAVVFLTTILAFTGANSARRRYQKGRDT